MGESHFADQARESGARVRRGAGEAQILVDDGDSIGGPAELACAVD